MKQRFLIVLAGILALSMILTPLVVAKPGSSMTLVGNKVATGIVGENGSFKIFTAGESSKTHYKMKDLLDIFTGGIEGDGHYYGMWWEGMSKQGEHKINITGYWIFEGITIDDVEYTGTLRVGQNGEKLWIESGTGDLSSIRGRGTATYYIEDNYSVFEYEMEICINP